MVEKTAAGVEKHQDSEAEGDELKTADGNKREAAFQKWSARVDGSRRRHSTQSEDELCCFGGSEERRASFH